MPKGSDKINFAERWIKVFFFVIEKKYERKYLLVLFNGINFHNNSFMSNVFKSIIF